MPPKRAFGEGRVRPIAIAVVRVARRSSARRGTVPEPRTMRAKTRALFFFDFRMRVEADRSRARAPRSPPRSGRTARRPSATRIANKNCSRVPSTPCLRVRRMPRPRPRRRLSRRLPPAPRMTSTRHASRPEHDLPGRQPPRRLRLRPPGHVRPRGRGRVRQPPVAGVLRGDPRRWAAERRERASPRRVFRRAFIMRATPAVVQVRRPAPLRARSTTGRIPPPSSG